MVRIAVGLTTAVGSLIVLAVGMVMVATSTVAVTLAVGVTTAVPTAVVAVETVDGRVGITVAAVMAATRKTGSSASRRLGRRESASALPWDLPARCSMRKSNSKHDS